MGLDRVDDGPRQQGGEHGQDETCGVAGMPPALSSRSFRVALTKRIAGMAPSWIGTL
jgi:hypothetical protein